MTNATETFNEPFLGRVKTALSGATSISWDGCHKIYIAMDLESHSEQVEYGYNTVSVTDPDDALAMLYVWWEGSCPLRFINSIGEDSGYVAVISQFEYEQSSDE